VLLSPHEVAWVVQRTWPSTTTDEQTHAVAVALAESGGDTDALARSADLLPDGKTPNPNAGNRDHGLFQLSGRWQWDKVIAAGGDWRDPLVNSSIGYAVYVAAGRKWTPWHVYQSETSGSWLTRLPDARLAVPHPFPIPDRLLGTPPAPVDLSAVLSDLTAIGEDLTGVARDLTAVRAHFT
jgi:hypothetical protein